MNSGCGMNPTTFLFPSTTTIVERMCASVSSSCSILNPVSSVSGVTTIVSRRACTCAEHSFGSCPAATHCVTMSVGDGAEVAAVFGVVHHRHDGDVLGAHHQRHLRAGSAGGSHKRLRDHDLSSKHRLVAS